MRTHSNNKDKKVAKRNTKKLAIYTTVLVVAIAIITLAIVLPLTLGQTYDPPYVPVVTSPEPPPPPTPQPPPPPQHVLPMEDFTLGKTASLDRLVFHSSLNNWRTHNGVNFNATAGTVVSSISAGEVIRVEHTQLEGGVVTVRHANGMTASYHGLGSDIRVEEGQTIAQGTILGTVAAVRPVARSEGSHMHLRVREANGNLIDPLTLFPDLADNK